MAFRFMILSALLLALPHPGNARIAEVFCDDRARLEDRFLSEPGATRRGRGLRGAETLMEVWVQPRTGAWTLVQQYANGTACVVAMGENWETLQPVGDPS
ncbi:hypothetical protein [Tropicimonas sp. S265A]|uniref:hypothetical protein n=1 Tax=Tropicimonas sp. S265A TaxID=3415134 RepID=UPI003C7A7198